MILDVLLGSWRVGLAGLAVGALVGSGGTWWLRDQMAVGAQLQQQRVVTRTVIRQGATTERVVYRYITRQAAAREVTRTVLQEVPHVVTVEVDRSFGSVPVGFVRLFDAGAAGVPSVPDPAGRADDAASGVALSAVLSTAIENDGICHLNAGQLVALQEWVRERARVH